MLHILIAILGIFLTIFFIVGVHEYGHFIVARLMGVKVLRFSIGFGKTLLRWHGKQGTEYVFAAIPLGGYVKMLDEAEAPVSEKELPFAYNRQPIYKKAAIVMAGPLFNLLFAFCIYWLVFMIGFTSTIPLIGNVEKNSIAEQAGLKAGQEIIAVNHNPTSGWMSVIIYLLPHIGEKKNIPVSTRDLKKDTVKKYSLDIRHWKMDDLKPDALLSLGIIPYQPVIPAIIGNFAPTSPAKNILKKGDKILAINHKTIKDWIEFAEEIDKYPDQTVQLKLQRNGKIIEISVPTTSRRDMLFTKHGMLGIAPDFKMPDYLLREQKYGVLDAAVHAYHETKDYVNLNILVIGKLLNGTMSIKSLSGPISIFESAGSALNMGIIPFLTFLAFLSIAVGLINVLPIPGLDGGHLLFLLIETIRGRPISQRVQLLIYRLGMIVLFLLITQALVNDILRI